MSVSGATAEPRLVPPPPGGLYRIGLKPDPFTWREPRKLSEGHEHALAPADLSSPALANAATILGITLPPAQAPPASPQGMPTPW